MSADREKVLDLLNHAWGVIANAGTSENLGDWTRLHPTWQEAAAKWRDDYHALLAALSPSPVLVVRSPRLEGTETRCCPFCEGGCKGCTCHKQPDPPAEAEEPKEAPHRWSNGCTRMDEHGISECTFAPAPLPPVEPQKGISEARLAELERLVGCRVAFPASDMAPVLAEIRRFQAAAIAKDKEDCEWEDLLQAAEERVRTLEEKIRTLIGEGYPDHPDDWEREMNELLE